MTLPKSSCCNAEITNDAIGNKFCVKCYGDPVTPSQPEPPKAVESREVIALNHVAEFSMVAKDVASQIPRALTDADLNFMEGLILKAQTNAFSRGRRVGRKKYHKSKLKYYSKHRGGKENRCSRWSWDDVDLIMKHEKTDVELSKQLGRSVQAIQVKRNKIKYGR